MNISLQITAVVLAAACLCFAEGAPDGRLTRKQQRPTRGFKNVEMMTARGFGKRDHPHTRAQRDVDHQTPERERTNRGTPTFKSPTVGIARDFGKRTPESETEDQDYEAPARKKFNPKTSLMVAYDFGKRSGNDDRIDEEEEIRVTRGTFRPNANVLIARGYGKRTHLPKKVYGLDNFWDTLESSPEREGLEGMEEKAIESIPLEWFVNEMLNNPDFARSVIRKFVDLNQDGMLTSDELLRNVV